MVKSETKVKSDTKRSKFSFRRSPSGKSVGNKSGRTTGKKKLGSGTTLDDKKIGNLVLVPINKDDDEEAVSLGNLRSSGKLDGIVEEKFLEAADTDSYLTEDNIFDAGNRYFEEDYYPEAKKLYKEALKNTTQHDVKARLWLAMGNVSLRQIDENVSEDRKNILKKEIVDYYTIAMSLMHDNDEVLKTQAKLGTILYKLGDREGAEEHYDVALPHLEETTENISAQVLYNYAMTKFHKEDFSAAEIYFNKFLHNELSYDDLNLLITNFDITYYLGRTAFLSGNHDLVVNIYSTFLDEHRKVNPEPGEYDIGKIHLMLAQSYEKSGKYENMHHALDHYTSFLELKDPTLSSRLYSNEHANDRLEGDMVTVITRIGHLCFKAKNFSVAGNCLRKAYFAMKSFSIKQDLTLLRLLDRSYVSYTKANDKDNSLLILEEITSILEKTENTDNTVLSGEKIADYYEALGNLYKKSNKPHCAFESFSKCFEVRRKYLGPRDPELEKLICKVSTYLYSEGRYDEASDLCENIAYSSDNADNSRRALCIVGKIRAKQRDAETCVSAFEDALGLAKLKGENSLELADTYELFAQANFQLNCFDESIDCFHSAYKIRVTNEETTAKECLSIVRGMVDGYKMIRKYKLALISCSKLLAIQEELQIPDVEIASTKEIMADLHCVVGDSNSFSNALVLYRESSEILKEHKSTSDETLLLIYVKMARILGLKLNEYDKSMQLLHTVHKSYRFDDQGLKPICALRGLEVEGDLLFHKNDYTSALYKFVSINDYVGVVKPKVKENYKMQMLLDDCKLDLLYKIGCVYRKTCEYEAALDYLSRGLNMSVQSSTSPDGLENVRTSRFFYEIGLVHKEMNETSTAVDKLSEAGEILERIPVLDLKGVILSEDIEEQLLNMGCCRIPWK